MGISREQALDCFASDDLIGIGMEADAVRRQLHPEGVVSYVVSGAIDLTEFDPASSTYDALYDRIANIIESGGTGVHVHGLRNHGLEWCATLFFGIRQRFGSLWIGALSTSDVLALAASSGQSLSDALARLRDAGMDSLADTSDTTDTDQWIKVHRAAHQVGMKTSAAFVFGAGETAEQRLSYLEAIRHLQEESGGFTALVPSTVQPGTSQRAKGLEEATAVEYLKSMAIARMYVDNIDHVQASLDTQGLKVVQMGLRFGGNDVGAARPGAGSATEEELRRLIRDAGFRPVQRDPLYRTMFLN